MGFGGKILSKLFGADDDFSALELDEGLEEEFEWDWDHIVEERHLFKMSDEVQRDKYIRSLVEQIKDASVELEKLSAEYNLVTAMLKDMDEIDSLPVSEKLSLQDAARNILYYEDEARDYEAKRSAMTEAQFRSMERFEDSMPKAYEDMEEAERYKGLIKDDLRKLEGEKHAYLYRQDELKTEIGNLRGMTIICVFAAVLCVIMLLVLQFGLVMCRRFSPPYSQNLWHTYGCLHDRDPGCHVSLYPSSQSSLSQRICSPPEAYLRQSGIDGNNPSLFDARTVLKAAASRNTLVCMASSSHLPLPTGIPRSPWDTS